ncbi:MAG: hypothetical protein HRU09_15705 [Oligoflexales bacterium]|nr:hypothetical protein [Oligoflexales bacterium]
MDYRLPLLLLVSASVVSLPSCRKEKTKYVYVDNYVNASQSDDSESDSNQEEPTDLEKKAPGEQAKESENGDNEIDYSKCGYSSSPRDCDEEEKRYINDAMFLVNKIKAIAESDESLDKHFYSYETSSSTEKSVYLIGECHSELVHQIDNFAFIERTVAEGDYVLLEGLDRGKSNELYFELMGLVCTLEFERKGNVYDPGKKDSLCASMVLTAYTTKNAIPYDRLTLSKAKFNYWDNMEAWKISDFNEQLRERNRSMVASIEESIGGQKAFVIAGNIHSPIGEYAWLKKKYKYSRSVTVGKHVSSIYDDFPDELSTQEIFESLSQLDAVYLTHKKLFLDGSQDCLPAGLFESEL